MSQRETPCDRSRRADRGTIASQPKSGFRVQQRGAGRRRLPSQVTCQWVRTYDALHEPPRRFWVTTRDISASGISFYHRDVFYYGERLELELRLDGGELRAVTARVVRCRRTAEGAFEIGAAFERDAAPPPPADPRPAPVDGADM